jgi:predicted DNA-binding transcriptional regulator AlpA
MSKIEEQIYYTTVRGCADHWAYSQKSIRNWIKAGTMKTERLNNRVFIAWPEVWRHERGELPRPHSAARYRTPLLTKATLASAIGTSVSTIKRWMRDGLPARYIGPAEGVRFNRHDAREWLKARCGLEFPNLTQESLI